MSIAVQPLSMHMFTSLSVDEILLLRYMNWSTSFRGWLFNVEMALSDLNTEILFYLSSDRGQ